ncbi:MAG: hypothetical protein SFU86_17860 [Pirellulaceae bacterium]|nr:hypothetical protein [Pirellulaceae bacterium]
MERYRISADGYVYFVTWSVVDWLPVFIAESACRIVTESFDFAHVHKQLRINAFVIMPTHLHAIVFDANFDSTRLAATLNDVRKFTGRRLADYCFNHLPSCFREVLVQSAGTDRERRLWQPSRHPELLETETFWRQKFDYLHENPCRKGLVRRASEWRFSSAAHWLSDGREPSDVKLSGISW